MAKRKPQQTSFMDVLLQPSDEPERPKTKRVEHRRGEAPTEQRAGMCPKCGVGAFSLAIVAGVWYRTCTTCKDIKVID